MWVFADKVGFSIDKVGFSPIKWVSRSKSRFLTDPAEKPTSPIEKPTFSVKNLVFRSKK